MANRVTATQVDHWAIKAGAVRSVPECIDAAGNSFEATALGDEWNGYVLVKKKSPTGQVLAEIEVLPANGMKLDTCGICQSGRHIRISLGNHMSGEQSPEPLSRDLYVWQNIAAPYAVGAAPFGAEGAYMPEENSGGGGITEAQIDQIVAETVNALHLAHGGSPPSIRQGIEDKAKDAIRELNMHSDSMQYRGIDQWLRDRVYQTFEENAPGFWEWLRGEVRGGTDERVDAAVRSFALKEAEMNRDDLGTGSELEEAGTGGGEPGNGGAAQVADTLASPADYALEAEDQDEAKGV